MKRIMIHINAVLISMALGGAQLYAEQTTYPISTAEDLFRLAEQSQKDNFAGTTIVLEADINLSDGQETRNWSPIGSAQMPFCGEFNGNNHVIYNLYMLSSSFPQAAGLFAETGDAAVIHHLGLAQGQIMTDGTSNMGGFIGINRGKLHHCFSMLQLIAHAGSNIGGLVGVNYGKIAYSYHAGIIADGQNYIGGLVGVNKASGSLSDCYNMGYCKGSDHVGALFGMNEAPETQLTKVVFDQQLTRMYATGDGANDPILKDNTKYAVEKSEVFISKFSPFYEDPEKEWHYESAGTWSHPQLLCFKDHPASHVSVKAIWLDAEGLPLERAEGVGAPKEGNSPRNSFKLETMNHSTYGQGEWSSPSPEVIAISNPTGTKAEVSRPCGNQEVILTLRYDKFYKQIYTIVKGYEVFDAGKVNGFVVACWKEEGVTFKSNNRDGKEPTGGKDDDPKSETLSYHYMIIRDTVILDEQGGRTFESIDTFYLSQPFYKDWCLPTDVPGEYAFRRYVHDTKCKTEWTVSKGDGLVNGEAGVLLLSVRDTINPGLLFEKPDTLFAHFPTTLTIKSAQDASGGGGVFRYAWKMERKAWDADAQSWLEPEEDDLKNPLYIDGELVNTPSFDFTFTQPGQYTFTRRVTEESCDTKPMMCPKPHIAIIYEAINAGSIEHFERYLCTPDYSGTIHQKTSPTGGNGQYTYRWLCNGEPIPNTDTTALPLDSFPLERGKSYVFTRQVRDKNGLTDWTNSSGKVTIKVLSDFGEAWRLGLAQKQTITIPICAGDFPYEYVYTISDGSTQTYTFTNPGQRFQTDDLTGEGCPLEVTLLSEQIPTPEVELAPIVSVCQSDSHLKIAFEVRSGTLNRFDITFCQSAKEAGFRDSIGVLLPETGIINIPLPDFLPLGQQSLTLTFYSDEPIPETCRRTEPQTLTFSIDLDGYVRRKGDDIIYVDNSGRHTNEGLTFTAYQWYRNGELLSDETDQFHREYPSLNGVYQVEMTTPDGQTYRSCIFEARARTSIENPKSQTECLKILENGQIVIIVGNERYTVLGQKIQ